MFKKYIKYVSVVITPIFMFLMLFAFIDSVKLPNSNFKLNKLFSNANDPLGFLSSEESVETLNSEDLKLYVGGDNIGVKLNTKGVLVVGFSKININGEGIKSPAEEAGIELGDILIKVDNHKIENSKDLSAAIQKNKKEKIKLEIERNDEKISKEVKLIKEDEEYKLGLWVRDSTAGIGTLTFYEENSNIFGALGHPITDGDTNKMFVIEKGNVVESSVISVRKGERGVPGELKGMFINDKNTLASITKNTQTGIYGEVSGSIIRDKESRAISVGYRNEIEIGAAKILTTIDEGGPKEYDIEIVKLLSQNEPSSKSMIIKVTDPVLLEKTGGIVQGMSGSPIIQNGKIIGAVTHVLVNKPDVGYGIYIEWMLKDSGIME